MIYVDLQFIQDVLICILSHYIQFGDKGIINKQEASRPDSSAKCIRYLAEGSEIFPQAQNRSGLYEVISDHYWPKSHEKLSKIEIRSYWSRFEHCSE